jgi:nanoRNase/pAp phosphatase (c-di-AMP/oligoRNAs hydrolase)
VTAFVDSCIETVTDSARAVVRQSRGQPRVRRLLKLLANKKNILVTTHIHPDPDALASSLAMAALLRAKLPGSRVDVSIKGRIAGGINENFARLSRVQMVPWNDSALDDYDAIILLDVQTRFAYNPLPAGVMPLAVIDHHRAPPGAPKAAYHDIRTNVGACGSIVFAYYMELELPITPLLAASLLYAIETDLSGAAGTPNEIDNIALSGLTLLADTHALYQMRYFDLSQSYFQAFFNGIGSAQVYGNCVIAHLDTIDTMEKAAVVADTLLRYDQADWALVTAVFEHRLIISLRSGGDAPTPAADMMKKLLKNLGEGGGHLTKAGGFIPLPHPGDTATIQKRLTALRKRLLSAVGLKGVRAQRLVVG